MLIERKRKNGVIYLELMEEYYSEEKKRFEKKRIKGLGVEAPATVAKMTTEFAVVWGKGRTLGNAVPFSETVIGQFPPENSGEGVILPCDIVNCGKFRNGAERWWCRTHQVHWGTKADLLQAAQEGEECIKCANSRQGMDYTKNPFVIDPSDYEGGIGIWAALPTAINNTDEPEIEDVKIHVDARPKIGDKKIIDKTFPAVVVTANDILPLLGVIGEKKRIVIAPPSALAYLEALINNLPLDLLNCNKCHHPHLDLGDFAKNPHKKHFCGNCGVDSNWSKEPIISSPIKELVDTFTKNFDFINSDRTLDLRDYQDYQFKLWASTPAILWTSNQPQETGIHVHIYQNDTKIIDDTFGEVIWLDGSYLERDKLISEMLDKVHKNPI